MRSFVVLCLVVAGCSAKTVAVSGPGTSPSGATPGAALAAIEDVDPGGTGPSYSGTGFEVHEWGTNTVVVGSDGSMQIGLHHEEEDLPAFVYDRTKKTIAQPSSTDVKMETPVLYFYSDKPVTAEVAVDFPAGVLTQWYPGVYSLYPPVFSDRGDPALDPAFPFQAPSCRKIWGPEHGMLRWSGVQVLGRDAKITPPEAPLDRFSWSHARAVAANPVRITSPLGGDAKSAEEERFLFYRGLGSFPLDLNVAAQAGDAGKDGGLALTNRDRQNAIGAVFVLRVEADKASFRAFPEGIAPGEKLEALAPAATDGFDVYGKALARSLVTELDKAGLFHDESVSMVKTWARQWFRTPGIRVLYLSPRAWTDAQIPLTIDPVPARVVRQLIMRVEVITPAQEAVDGKATSALDSPSAAERAQATQHFDALGRFAEPRLRRAIAVLGNEPKGAFAYLANLASVPFSARTGE